MSDSVNVVIYVRNTVPETIMTQLVKRKIDLIPLMT